MVPFALPGERVRVRIFSNHKNYSEADLVAVLRPSPHRITPRCPLFGDCGGCQYQNLTYAEQLRWKQQHVAEVLQYMARIEFPVNPVIASPCDFGYRSKLTPHFELPRTGRPVEIPNTRPQTPDSAAPSAAGIAAASSSGSASLGTTTVSADRSAFSLRPSAFPIGFLKQSSRFSLVDVPQCPIATDAINARLPATRAEVFAKAAAGAYQRGATLLLRHSLEGVTSDYEATITEEVEGVRLRFLARDFFQNNPFILPAFTGYVREQAAAAGASFLVDAYCGSGLFALTAARRFEQVAGIELSASAVRWAQDNATANGITNATFRAGDASAIFAGLDFPATETAVIIDPPRRGCDEAFLRQLVAFGPRTIVYVSCDPATQMRDLATLLPAGYTLTAVQPFDLFPQTRHLECVITLQKS
ncbi:MAG: class I SAM-dependent RNA methyltransferase [Opitutaceae bacterium]|nr:class I SAM-dependent RNA methyltransferase [Opitutaceae bacterium]